MFNIKQSLLCISAISCMSLYATEKKIRIDNPIIIDNYKGSDTQVATSLENKTNYNYWLDNNIYVFNNNNDTSWIATNTVTIDTDYTLKLITNYTNGDYYIVLNCYNTLTNYGNVIIDGYGGLDLNFSYTSSNNGTIDIINGKLGLWSRAILTNEGTITLEGSSRIYINSGTLTNTGTIDISNITDLSGWYNNGTFTLEGGSTFILPRSISSKIYIYWWTNPITLNGSSDKPVNIVIPQGCTYINKSTEDLFKAIQKATGFTFGGEMVHVEFMTQEEEVEQLTETSIDDECEISYVDECD